jgi:hypothetical protein
MQWNSAPLPYFSAIDYRPRFVPFHDNIVIIALLKMDFPFLSNDLKLVGFTLNRKDCNVSVHDRIHMSHLVLDSLIG